VVGESPVAPAGGWGRAYAGKRVVDLVVLVASAVPALAVAAVAGVAIRLTSRGPVFFRQERIGLHGRPFVVWKLRTMVHGANPVLPDEERITRVGRWLRRSSLDELPQLLNVARGEMSIVGPRPTLAYQVERYDDRQRHRLDVKPGLTGLAQVRGRNALAWSERIEHDLEYVARQSPWFDLYLLVRTVGTVVSGVGHAGHPADDPLVAPPAAGTPSARSTGDRPR
jgi:lipopolysaccharide/colanic/teichoic acid biosynthesis glycosyltransferase